MHSLSLNVRYFLWPANYVSPSPPNFDSSVVSLGSSLWLPTIWTSCTIKIDGYSTADMYIAVIILMLLGAIPAGLGVCVWIVGPSKRFSVHSPPAIVFFFFAFLVHVTQYWESSSEPYMTLSVRSKHCIATYACFCVDVYLKKETYVTSLWPLFIPFSAQAQKFRMWKICTN